MKLVGNEWSDSWSRFLGDHSPKATPFIFYWGPSKRLLDPHQKGECFLCPFSFRGASNFKPNFGPLQRISSAGGSFPFSCQASNKFQDTQLPYVNCLWGISRFIDSSNTRRTCMINAETKTVVWLILSDVDVP